ncbi:DNA-processing protein DprA [Thermosipho atlanticus]|uniref:DNA processing protein n=1 Tax=Thermosipho atlanticus DSM 15807 TaxID=1123380 RepID=A0A1M5R8F6_9BACT|nr:DNA-processing protein DprA [Thermosipho atlanticus]SHH22644.1 DNA processing protein [Thermosipho atlanticus DSM 15807]
MTKSEIVLLAKLGYSIEEIEKISLVNNLNCLKDKGVKNKEILNKINEGLNSGEYSILTYWDDEYPDKLKNIWNPPIFLFYKGNISLLNESSLAVVGTRKISKYGYKVTKYFVDYLKKNFVIVSGMALGVDSVAHWNALGNTVAVLGSGVNVCYPKSNERLYNKILENGCVLSEYYPWEKPKKEYFPMRNRIVSGITDGVLIVEGKIKSGTMITAKFSLEFGREVFAIPGDIFNENSECPNFLIKNGAIPVTKPEDIVDYLQFERGIMYENGHEH